MSSRIILKRIYDFAIMKNDSNCIRLNVIYADFISTGKPYSFESIRIVENWMHNYSTRRGCDELYIEPNYGG